MMTHMLTKVKPYGAVVARSTDVPFCVEFARSPHTCVGFLQALRFPPKVELPVGVNESVNVWPAIACHSVQGAHELICPSFTVTSNRQEV